MIRPLGQRPFRPPDNPSRYGPDHACGATPPSGALPAHGCKPSQASTLVHPTAFVAKLELGRRLAMQQRSNVTDDVEIDTRRCVMDFYHSGMRRLQDRYEGRSVADRLAGNRMRT